MNFSAKQLNQYETVAEILSAQRKEKSINLDKAEKTLKISKKYLIALEEGHYEKLPSEIYVRSFAKAYARFLELEVNKVMEILNRELEIAQKINNPQNDLNTYQPPRLIITPKIIRNALIGLLLLGCLSYLGWQISAIFSPPPLKIIYPEKDLVITDNFITIKGQTEPESEVTINNQQILADKQGFFSKTVDLQTGINTIQITAKKKRSKDVTEIRRIMVERPEQKAPVAPAGVNSNLNGNTAPPEN